MADGGLGNDDLIVASGATAWGAEGDDFLTHTADDTGSSALHGGDGNDTLVGTSADSHLDGGAGDDMYLVKHSTVANADGLSLDFAEGDDVVVLDPNLVFTTAAAGGNTPVVLHDFAAGDRIVFGVNDQTSFDGMNWVKNADGSFTLHQGNATGNVATNLTVFTTDGNAPFEATSNGPSPMRTTAWNDVPVDDPRGFEVTLSNSNEFFQFGVVGTNGADSLFAGEENYASHAYGYDGNDTIRGSIDVNIYGGNGDDDLSGYYNPIYGDAGNDEISNMDGSAYGGTGQDLIFAGSYGGETDEVGAAYGGDGNDTIIGEEATDGGGHLNGDAGDDQITAHANSYVEGGTGNDTVLLHGSFNYGGGEIALGVGNDQVIYDTGIPMEVVDATTTVTDFDPAQDHLAIIVPQIHQGELVVTHYVDVAQGFTEYTISTPWHSQTPDPSIDLHIRVLGVTDPNMPIALYDSEASALAGTSYGNATSTDSGGTAALNHITYLGTAADDTIDGTGTFYERYFGAEGDDSITTDEANLIYGGAGADTLSGHGIGSNAVLISGGDGSDVITTDSAAGVSYDTIQGDAGNDIITVGHAALVNGGAGDDVITVNHSADVNGGDGNDTIRISDGVASGAQGGNGDDLIIANSQNYIRAGAGDDTVIIKQTLAGENTSWVTLSDTFAELDSDLFAWDSNDGNSPIYGNQGIDAFDPTRDHFALIIPQSQIANYHISVADNATGDSIVTVTHGATAEGNTQTFWLASVTGFTSNDIALYDSQTALLARQSYGTA